MSTRASDPAGRAVSPSGGVRDVAPRRRALAETRGVAVGFQALEVSLDGASLGNPGPAGIGAVFRDTTGSLVTQLSIPLGVATNNVAEYLALIYALEEARARGAARLAVKTDSELLVRQLGGRYKVRDATLRWLHDLAKQMMRRFERCDIQHVPRELNREADRLAGRAAQCAQKCS